MRYDNAPPSKVQETPMMQERKFENWRCETSGGSCSLQLQDVYIILYTTTLNCNLISRSPLETWLFHASNTHEINYFSKNSA